MDIGKSALYTQPEKKRQKWEANVIGDRRAHTYTHIEARYDILIRHTGATEED